MRASFSTNLGLLALLADSNSFAHNINYVLNLTRARMEKLIPLLRVSLRWIWAQKGEGAHWARALRVSWCCDIVQTQTYAFGRSWSFWSVCFLCLVVLGLSSQWIETLAVCHYCKWNLHEWPFCQRSWEKQRVDDKQYPFLPQSYKYSCSNCLCWLDLHLSFLWHWNWICLGDLSSSDIPLS